MSGKNLVLGLLTEMLSANQKDIMIMMIILYNLVGQLPIHLVSQLLIFSSFLLFLFYLHSCFFFFLFYYFFFIFIRVSFSYLWVL